MGRPRGLMVAVISVSTFVGCSPERLQTDAGSAVGSGGSNIADQKCGQTTTLVSVQSPPPPEILILQDRSLSMNNGSDDQSCPGGCGASSKWSQASTAIENLVTATQATVKWGLSFCGDGGVCDATAVAKVGFALNSAAAIAAAYTTVAPEGGAPTATAIYNAVAYLQGIDDETPKYLLLVTDGHSGCAQADGGLTIDADAATAVMGARSAGFRTFVLGIADSSDSTATALLSQLAASGDEQQEGSATAYYTVSDIAASGHGGAPLNSVINTEVGAIVGCTIAVAPPPEFVSLEVGASTSKGAVEIPQDPTNGWTFTDSTDRWISLNGSFCVALMDGTYSDVTVSYGCESVPI
jgi:von Willebrand factor type A domain